MDREDAKKQGVKDVEVFDDDDDDDDDGVEEMVTDFDCVASQNFINEEEDDEEDYRYVKYGDDEVADEEEDEEDEDIPGDDEDEDEEEEFPGDGEGDEFFDDEFIDDEEYDEEDEQGEIDPSSPVPMVRSIKTTEMMPLTPFMQRLGFGTGVQVLRVKRTLNPGADRSPWAIKMLCPRKESSATINERLVQEAEILRELSHPNIVGFRGHGEISADHTYLAMEYCSLTLGNVLEERFNEELGPLEVPNASKVVLNVLSALVYLHTKALLIHGDIKSYNVLIKNDYEMVKLCDFGVSIKVTPDGKIDRAANPDAHYIGTSLWLPPEMLPHSGQEHHEVSTKSDMFAFGLLVYEMLVCTPPHTYPGLQDGYVSYPSEVIMMRQTSSKLAQEAASKPRRLEMSVTLSDDDDDDDVQIVQDTDEECTPSTGSRKRGITETSGGDGEVVISPKKAKSVPTDGEQPAQEQTSVQEGEVANVREEIKEKTSDQANEIKPTDASDAEGNLDSAIKSDNDPDQEKKGEPASEAAIVSAQEGERIDAFDKENNKDSEEKQDKEEATERKIKEEAKKLKVEEEEATERKVDREEATVKTADIDGYEVKIADKNEATEKPADVEASEKAEAKEKASEQVEATVPAENKAPIEALPVSNVAETGQCVSKDENTPASNDDEKMVAGGNAAPQAADIIYTISDSDDESQHPKGIILEVSDDESDYDGEREVGEITYEEGVEYESTFLNYNHMGTRPPIPSEVTLGPDYDGLLTVFLACTEPSPLDRPSAATLLEAFRQELGCGAVDGTEDGGQNPEESAVPTIPVEDAESNAEIVQLLRSELAKE